MIDLNDNDNDETLETTQASAGMPQRPGPLAFGIQDNEPEPSAEDLDARQEAIGTTRRDGPPLPESDEPNAMAMAIGEEAGEPPTEVAKP